MLGKRLGFVLLVTLALPLLCHGDLVITFLDSGEPVQWTINNSGPLSCGSALPEFCEITSTGGFTVASDFNFLFNIFDPNGVTLSDTLHITGSASLNQIIATFQSDSEGVPLVPFVGGQSI